MTIELHRISEIAKRNVKVQNLAHFIDEASLKQIHRRMDGKKAKGIDKVSKDEYAKNLEENIEQLVLRMKRQAYQPQPTRRVYIDKPGSKKKRPLGISCYEDKLVENRVAEILSVIYEPKFYEFSYGFRPEKNCHQAVRKLIECIRKNVGYVVEADIRSFFDTIDHEWMIQFLEHDIADRKFIDLIKKMLKADVLDGGELLEHEVGSPQGSAASPIFANIYLHYVLDLWFTIKISKECRGDAYIIRYCDDFVCCFQYKEDAEKFYKELPKRFTKFGLELAEEKTRILEFGRFAEKDRAARSEGKPETFDFLGFTFYCSMDTKKRFFRVKVISCRKKTTAKLKKLNLWLKEHRDWSVKDIITRFNQSLLGHYHYYGVTDNFESIAKFRFMIVNLLFKWLNRRSERKSYTWDAFRDGLLKTFPIANPKIYVSLIANNA
ncbi:group II intron reverse transcriptase/maturase [Petroclostridium sp. X23]|uniref:group II intron reverse transcriptase/maturase n=1 Tax=Petroclostridium sp. X23 TaxID=3045146 RepID=UPI0024ADA596|nr:group II intron reverse transcriptase/maturase [Petroclostridium sp. X23]WHH56822.1 group II intron reverse transcriptase/maturase [Petroclostridium sp. X23]WHH57484.1 group II intron reverse transcriptase/maturase [Petroclostridium sp. X23]WHH59706.1 group II intron reverse transcriptase/maturase [Petroclostridium sp. X23]WHH60143.1 group II intron reverse transcriptase/maturase [Petroclostridium sp. X23]WHH60969.1 group II intron reverse transcriptase/maturase [Petroclostridium sp. X23]